jgi:proteasome lid subunit RPN8/RPN11
MSDLQAQYEQWQAALQQPTSPQVMLQLENQILYQLTADSPDFAACRVIVPLSEATKLTVRQALAQVMPITAADGIETEFFYQTKTHHLVSPITTGTDCHVALPRMLTAAPRSKPNIGMFHSHPDFAFCAFSRDDMQSIGDENLDEAMLGCPLNHQIITIPIRRDRNDPYRSKWAGHIIGAIRRIEAKNLF